MNRPLAAATVTVCVFVVAGAAQTPVRFTDVTRESGVSFHHINGASPDKHLVETMGSGGLFFDYDNDGWIDLFLVDGGSLADARVASQAKHRLYHNRGNGTFDDVSARSGIQHRDYGMGACAGDYDNDGWIDLYVTNFGPNVLYRNRGDGSFTDVTAAARVGEPRWSASCAFADLDKDGDLDLFVVNYVDADRSKTPYCGNAKLGQRFYCHPLNYPSLPNTLYRNDGHGVFTDVSDASGIGASRGNGLGLVVTDYDEDGWPDVFVANDSVANFLFRNTGKLRFAEAALGAGVAVATDGQARAGMGVDAGDYDGSGRQGIVVGNFTNESMALYRNEGSGLFTDEAPNSGIGKMSAQSLTFAVFFFDYDLDGLLDVFAANGHVSDDISVVQPNVKYAQAPHLFRNKGKKKFEEKTGQLGRALQRAIVGRGAAYGDFDNDGDLDLLITSNNGPARLLRNENANQNDLLRVKLVGTRANRDGIGAKLMLKTAKEKLFNMVKTGSSYCSQSELPIVFGLGVPEEGKTLALEITWPGGGKDTLTDLKPNQSLTVQEGKGIIATAPIVFAKPSPTPTPTPQPQQ